MAEHNFSVENTLTLLLDDKKYHSLRDTRDKDGGDWAYQDFLLCEVP